MYFGFMVVLFFLKSPEFIKHKNRTLVKKATRKQIQVKTCNDAYSKNGVISPTKELKGLL
jgi:sulfur relay (sulfurtransferase) complex TusBCD TusD component (DsrE family)